MAPAGFSGLGSAETFVERINLEMALKKPTGKDFVTVVAHLGRVVIETVLLVVVVVSPVTSIRLKYCFQGIFAILSDN